MGLPPITAADDFLAEAGDGSPPDAVRLAQAVDEAARLRAAFTGGGAVIDPPAIRPADLSPRRAAALEARLLGRPAPGSMEEDEGEADEEEDSSNPIHNNSSDDSSPDMEAIYALLEGETSSEEEEDANGDGSVVIIVPPPPSFTAASLLLAGRPAPEAPGR